MAVPKRKRSKERNRRRRAQQKLKKVTLVLCPNCKSLKPSHRVCPVCGYYAGRQVITKAQGEQ